MFTKDSCPETDFVLMQKVAAAHSLKSAANRPSKIVLVCPVGLCFVNMLLQALNGPW